ncbi:MAG: chorismate-binding protein, partial [Gammaproteobacteria bacterium]|nr:chorismate-binding protein [Gammaproteobacteria bacterium]
MNQEKFDELKAQGYNRIPVMREVLADLDTPLSTYLKLASGPYSYLFESVQGGEKWGRYSIIGLPCKTLLKVSGQEVTFIENDKVKETLEVDNPLEWIESFQARYRVPELSSLPLFTGGLVGYFGYDTVRYIEPRLKDGMNPDTLKTPDILLMVSEEVVVFDNLSGKLYVIVHVDPENTDALDQGLKRLDELVIKLRDSAVSLLMASSSQSASDKVSEEDFVSGFTRKGFESAVERIKEYILEGDVMQVVLSQRMTIPYKARPLDLYRALRGLNPSPYMYFMDMGDFHIV